MQALGNFWLKKIFLSFLSPPKNYFIKNWRRGYTGSPNKNTSTGFLPSTNIFSQGAIILFVSILLIEEFRNICASWILIGHFTTALLLLLLQTVLVITHGVWALSEKQPFRLIESEKRSLGSAIFMLVPSTAPTNCGKTYSSKYPSFNSWISTHQLLTLLLMRLEILWHQMIVFW